MKRTPIQLAEAPLEVRKKYAVWRTDYYICTGIAYAKTMGKSVEDFAAFVGSIHSIGRSRDEGVTPVVQLLHFVMGNYEGGCLEVVSESQNDVTMRCNRPYRTFFRDGPVLGVSLEEFETYLWKHVAIMLKSIGFTFGYRIEGDIIELRLSLEDGGTPGSQP
jgi:hypothetical protein